MAQKVMSDITDFASRTPFQVDELTDSWVKLANQGFRPTMDQLTKLGDLASSTGKPFDQLTEAVIDAQVGQFERLKEFGIKAEKSGNKVRFSFKGQTTEVANTEKAIQDYMLSLGELEGVQGSMAAISATTGGQLSNLQDRMTMLYKEIADALRPAIGSLIDGMAGMIERLRGVVAWVQENRQAVMGWVVAIGKIAGAFLAVIVAAKALSVIVSIVMGIVKVFQFLAGVLRVVRIIMLILNAVVLANPWIVLAIGIGFLIAALVKLAGGFQNIWDILKRMGEFFNVFNPFRWMLILIDKVFPQFKQAVYGVAQGIVDAFKKAFEWLDNKIFQPFKKLFKKLFSVDAGKFIAGPESLLQPEGDPYASNANKPGGGGTGKGTAGAMSQGLSEVRGGGGQIKNITINIQKLNDGGITISTATLGMGTAQVRAELERMLLSVVNDVNYQ